MDTVIHYLSEVWGKLRFFYIHQGHFKLMKSDRKTCIKIRIMLQNIEKIEHIKTKKNNHVFQTAILNTDKNKNY